MILIEARSGMFVNRCVRKDLVFAHVPYNFGHTVEEERHAGFESLRRFPSSTTAWFRHLRACLVSNFLIMSRHNRGKLHTAKRLFQSLCR